MSRFLISAVLIWLAGIAACHAQSTCTTYGSIFNSTSITENVTVTLHGLTTYPANTLPPQDNTFSNPTSYTVNPLSWLAQFGLDPALVFTACPTFTPLSRTTTIIHPFSEALSETFTLVLDAEGQLTYTDFETFAPGAACSNEMFNFGTGNTTCIEESLNSTLTFTINLVVGTWTVSVAESSSEQSYLGAPGVQGYDFTNTENGFAQGSFLASTVCHDDRDSLIAEYKTDNVQLHPGATGEAAYASCADFTQQDSNLNVGSPAHPATENWWVLASLVPVRLAAWRALAFDPINFPSGRKINSAYRSPIINQLAGGVSNSRHVYGDAVDLKTIGMSTAACTQNAPAFAMDAACLDIRRTTNTALAAGWDWLETWQPTHYGCQPSRGACVHADMRYTDDTYLNP
jgi:hypothetical protein